MAAIDIRPVRALSEMHAVVELQETFWGHDIESVIPAHMLFSLANYGGHVLVAFDGVKPVGMLVGFLGTNIEETRRPAMANLQIVSKRMVVLPEYRNQGIAYRLKLAQRDFALKQGVRLVVWTYDPLMAPNAHLNIRKLGGISHAYLEDYYGTGDEGGLATLGSSDRLQVEWWVTNRRVEERIYGTRGGLRLDHYLGADTVILNRTTVSASGFAVPTEPGMFPSTSLVMMEIPSNYATIVREDPELARTWRAHSRALFKQLFAHGFVVTDFMHETHEARDRAFYLLSYNGPTFEGFGLN